MIVKSEKHPNLLVVGVVKFKDGEAEVTNPDLIERLRRFEHMGVVVAEAEKSAPEGNGEPKGNASVDEWRAYAVQQGRDAEDVADLKRDEIKQLLAE